MKLESQVCSIDYAKKLKELGVKQESLFCYQEIQNSDPSVWPRTLDLHEFRKPSKDERPAAFTLSELLTLLPRINYCEPQLLRGYLTGEKELKYCFRYGYEDKQNSEFVVLNPCDSAAKMLIYLIENELMEVAE